MDPACTVRLRIFSTVQKNIFRKVVTFRNTSILGDMFVSLSKRLNLAFCVEAREILDRDGQLQGHGAHRFWACPTKV